MPINTANKSSAVPITTYGSLIFEERSRADRDTSPFTLVVLSQPERLRHRFRNNVMGGLSPRSSQVPQQCYGWSVPQVVGVEEFTGVAGVVLPAEMCEESELSELSPLSEAALHRRGYVSSFSNFSEAGGRSGKV